MVTSMIFLVSHFHSFGCALISFYLQKQTKCNQSVKSTGSVPLLGPVCNVLVCDSKACTLTTTVIITISIIIAFTVIIIHIIIITLLCDSLCHYLPSFMHTVLVRICNSRLIEIYGQSSNDYDSITQRSTAGTCYIDSPHVPWVHANKWASFQSVPTVHQLPFSNRVTDG